MTKKFITSLLITVVFAGFVLFADSQVAAEPPTDAERIIRCPDAGEALRLVFDEGGALTAAYWCATDDSGECISEWELLREATTAHIGNRQIVNNELIYWCQGPIGSVFGVPWYKP